MIFTRRRCVLVVIAAALLAAAPADAITDKERFEAFVWFDALGHPDIKGKPLISINRGLTVKAGSESIVIPPHTYAFLLEADTDGFTALTLDLVMVTSGKSAGVVTQGKALDLAYQKLDLQQWSAQRLAADKPWPGDELEAYEFDASEQAGRPLAIKSRLFILARACQLAGHRELAQELCDRAAGMIDLDAAAAEDEPRTFLHSLKLDLAAPTYARALLMFADEQVPRTQILAAFEAYLRAFPDGADVDAAKYTVDLLKKMVEEDRLQAKTRRRPWKDSTPSERTAELIYQLRNESESDAGWATPGMKAAFPDMDLRLPPSHLLEEMEFDAVPQLIAAIDDHRFTRVIRHGRDHDFRHPVMRIGDVALEVLERIAARQFMPRTNTNAALASSRKWDPKAEATAWWTAVQRRGERQVLMEAVMRADWNSPAQAARLVKNYPDAAVGPLILAIEKDVEDRQMARHLMGVASRIDDVRITDALERVLKKSPHRSNRINAMQFLHQRKAGIEMAPLLARELESLIADVRDQQEMGTDLVRVLYRLSDPAAVDALRACLPKMGVTLRMEAIRMLDEYHVLGYYFRAEKPPPPKDPARQRLIAEGYEKLLVACLDDVEARRNVTIGVEQGEDHFMVTSPRIGDMAAMKLAKIWPNKYKFDLKASEQERDRQRIAIYNTWRAQRPEPADPKGG